MTEEKTKFPKPMLVEVWGGGEYYFLDPDDVEEWFKQCIEDFPLERSKWDPQGYLRTKGHMQYALNPTVSKLLEDWFKKWLGRFKNGEAW